MAEQTANSRGGNLYSPWYREHAPPPLPRARARAHTHTPAHTHTHTHTHTRTRTRGPARAAARVDVAQGCVPLALTSALRVPQDAAGELVRGQGAGVCRHQRRAPLQ